MIQTNHFGLHRHDNLLYLQEQGGGRCLTPGLDGLESPIEVSPGRGLRCPHQLGNPEPGPVLDHPFVRAMGPHQEAGLFHVRPEHVNWLWRLSVMTPGLDRNVEPYWCLPKPRQTWIARRLNLTNVAPQAIIELTPAELVEMERVSELPRTRNLILSGPLKVPRAVLLDPTGLDWNHDWAAEGRRQLYRLIRRSEP